MVRKPAIEPTCGAVPSGLFETNGVLIGRPR